MNQHLLDQLSRALAGRRSRRVALASGGVGLAALAAGASGLHGSGAQGTPAPLPDVPAAGVAAEDLLFVQIFAGGTWLPREGDADAFTLTLTGAAAQTIYLSDRPERLVGAIPTQRFLDGLGFTPENPPNAALVTATDDGADVLVIELIDPRYDEATATLTYEARLLENYAEHGLAFLADQQGDLSIPERFGAASLFIDSCSDHEVRCCTDALCADGIVGHSDIVGYCWDLGDFCCVPCHGSGRDWDNWCNATFPACQGQCTSIYVGCF